MALPLSQYFDAGSTRYAPSPSSRLATAARAAFLFVALRAEPAKVATAPRRTSAAAAGLAVL
ncbi:MAG: hypothetical protein HY681_13965 [Chloroflexi bacterium]|nr:hypothetical protein [Chloroflexota bacterium]